MPLAVAEFQLILARLAEDLGTRVDRLLPRLSGLTQQEAMAFITDAYPDLADPYLSASSDLTATWYEEQPGPAGFVAKPADLAPADQLAASARWALLQATPTMALRGSATRSIFGQSRQTVLLNASNDVGTRWARYASANACGFCRMLATRSGKWLYTSEEAATRVVGRGQEMTAAERRMRASGQVSVDQSGRGRGTGGRFAAGGIKARGVRKLGDKYHDHCHCIAVPVRAGDTFDAPDYMKQWEQDYINASRETKKVGKYGALDPKAIAAHMDAAGRERRAVPKSGTGGPPKPPTGKGKSAAGSAQPPHGPSKKWMGASKAAVQALPPKTRQALVDYTGSDHERINGWLRRRGAQPDPWVESRVKRIDDGLARTPLEERTYLTRRTDASAFGLSSGAELGKISNKTRVERGYVSTTRDAGGGEGKTYANPIHLDVVAPPGTPAAALEDISKFPRQQEILLGRDLEYVLVDPHYDETLGMWRATMRIIG